LRRPGAHLVGSTLTLLGLLFRQHDFDLRRSRRMRVAEAIDRSSQEIRPLTLHQPLLVLPRRLWIRRRAADQSLQHRVLVTEIGRHAMEPHATIGIEVVELRGEPPSGNELAPPWRAHFGMLIAGWGVFNLVEGVVDHQLLDIHHVRDDLGAPLGWDLGFLAFGALLVVAGLTLARASPGPGERPDQVSSRRSSSRSAEF
jgi:hypothetical protein